MTFRTKVRIDLFEIDDFMTKISELLLKLEMPTAVTESNFYAFESQPSRHL